MKTEFPNIAALIKECGSNVSLEAALSGDALHFTSIMSATAHKLGAIAGSSRQHMATVAATSRELFHFAGMMMTTNRYDAESHQIYALQCLKGVADKTVDTQTSLAMYAEIFDMASSLAPSHARVDFQHELYIIYQAAMAELPKNQRTLSSEKLASMASSLPAVGTLAISSAPPPYKRPDTAVFIGGDYIAALKHA